MNRSVKLEEHVSIYEDFLKNTDGDYGYQGQGFLNGRKKYVPKNMYANNAQAVERVRLRMKNGHPPLLISYDPDTGIKIFAEEDKEAYEHGYICENCIQYQAVPNAPTCNWLTNPTDGCGHRNY